MKTKKEIKSNTDADLAGLNPLELKIANWANHWKLIFHVYTVTLTTSIEKDLIVSQRISSEELDKVNDSMQIDFKVNGGYCTLRSGQKLEKIKWQLLESFLPPDPTSSDIDITDSLRI